VREILQMHGSLGAGAGALVPVSVSTGEAWIPPEIVRRPGMLEELQRLNRGEFRHVTDIRSPMRLAGGGLVAIQAATTAASAAAAAGVDGAPGSVGADGAAGADSVHRVILGLEAGLVARSVEELIASRRGGRMIIESVGKHPRALRRASGSGD
jgi:hypothetical protein